MSNEGEPSGYGSPEYVDPEVRCAAPCCAALAALRYAGHRRLQAGAARHAWRLQRLAESILLI